MRVEYELTEQDLEEVTLLQIGAQRERIRKSPVPFVLGVGIAALIAWPVWNALSASLPMSPGLRAVVYLGAVLVAAAFAWWMRRFMPKFDFKRLNRGVAQRAAREAASKSTLGRVLVELNDDALVYQDSKDTTRIPLSDLAKVMRSEAVTAVFLRSGGVVVLPRRAFHDAASAEAFARDVERRATSSRPA